jgi:hypothetical protein
MVLPFMKVEEALSIWLRPFGVLRLQLSIFLLSKSNPRGSVYSFRYRNEGRKVESVKLSTRASHIGSNWHVGGYGFLQAYCTSMGCKTSHLEARVLIASGEWWISVSWALYSHRYCIKGSTLVFTLLQSAFVRDSNNTCELTSSHSSPCFVRCTSASSL